MINVKNVLQSRTVWSNMVALVAILVGLTGHVFTSADQAMLVDIIMGGLAAIGSITGIYYRIVATHTLVGSSQAKQQAFVDLAQLIGTAVAQAMASQQAVKAPTDVVDQ